MNQIMVLGILIAFAVFVLDFIFWNMMAPWPFGMIMGFVIGAIIVAPIIVGFRILSKRKE